MESKALSTHRQPLSLNHSDEKSERTGNGEHFREGEESKTESVCFNHYKQPRNVKNSVFFKPKPVSKKTESENISLK